MTTSNTRRAADCLARHGLGATPEARALRATADRADAGTLVAFGNGPFGIVHMAVAGERLAQMLRDGWTLAANHTCSKCAVRK